MHALVERAPRQWIERPCRPRQSVGRSIDGGTGGNLAPRLWEDEMFARQGGNGLPRGGTGVGPGWDRHGGMGRPGGSGPGWETGVWVGTGGVCIVNEERNNDA